MAIEKSLISGLLVLKEEDTNCEVYFNEKTLRDNIMIAYHSHEVDMLQIYHMNDNEVYNFLMEIDGTISKITTYRMVKDIYTLYNEHELIEFLNVIEEMCIDVESSSIQEPTTEERLDLHIEVAAYFNKAWEELNNPSPATSTDINGKSVYSFVAKRG